MNPAPTSLHAVALEPGAPRLPAGPPRMGRATLALCRVRPAGMGGGTTSLGNGGRLIAPGHGHSEERPQDDEARRRDVVGHVGQCDEEVHGDACASCCECGSAFAEEKGRHRSPQNRLSFSRSRGGTAFIAWMVSVSVLIDREVLFFRSPRREGARASGHEARPGRTRSFDGACALAAGLERRARGLLRVASREVVAGCTDLCPPRTHAARGLAFRVESSVGRGLHLPARARAKGRCSPPESLRTARPAAVRRRDVGLATSSCSGGSSARGRSAFWDRRQHSMAFHVTRLAPRPWMSSAGCGRAHHRKRTCSTWNGRGGKRSGLSMWNPQCPECKSCLDRSQGSPRLFLAATVGACCSTWNGRGGDGLSSFRAEQREVTRSDVPRGTPSRAGPCLAGGAS
ncbi:hypothetical protein MEBOL_003290 [Melittangium boletus DSM 14713]|uniref:Uncharacterized protein n=1 Tax=Melittangium boletus DSM 14713 TaxID=1294270 RepID=A0A250IDI2_9BACT|nr:hypothetical protein MEBOL_003290 [Melittangium boletus DSM 14713]